MFPLYRSVFKRSLSALHKNASITKDMHTTVINMKPNVAVVLSGCGVYDGSEVHESSAVLVHLSRAGAAVAIFAPDTNQLHTINHTKGETMEPNRNVLVESARIARGKISPLSNLKAADFDAVVFPGGFGAAKNLLCCISPVIAAKVIPGCEVTVGQEQEDGGRWPYAGTAGAIKAMGATHVPKNVTESHTDMKHKIVTTPAFMCETKFHEVFDGIGKMINGVLKLVK
ncbi:ES1 protein homolog, mitochondrial-like isoform X2 [Dreissena polymorpha]|uniref:ES1 protein homolog, mitochondrial-like isoform X2 n=1 Tax=Dreissena polymorpha TaxID=45954 RepID=UPI002263F6EA|nr:ES1 protein homolog, mitochondrial-like isoform X2 [Dreissena polymorpha]